ncbi:MAG: hypothetical protein K6C32_02350, partial [Bacilli bacterium]|nr:hypothetical protein [Bacilli bacterium]
GILFGCLFNEKAIGGIASIAISGQSLLSGMWFPLEGMSGGFITFMNCLPFRNASMLLTNSLNGVENMFNDFWLPLIVVVAYSIAVVVTAIIVFKHKMSAK